MQYFGISPAEYVDHQGVFKDITGCIRASAGLSRVVRKWQTEIVKVSSSDLLFHIETFGARELVSGELAEAISPIVGKQVQWLPVTVLTAGRKPSLDQRFIMHWLCVPECINWTATKHSVYHENKKYPLEDLIIDPRLVPQGTHVFSTAGYSDCDPILSEQLRDHLASFPGLKFPPRPTSLAGDAEQPVQTIESYLQSRQLAEAPIFKHASPDEVLAEYKRHTELRSRLKREDLWGRIRIHVELGEYRIGTGATEVAIVRLESSVGGVLPADYRRFVQEFSWLDLGCSDVLGLSNDRGDGAAEFTAEFRGQKDLDWPSNKLCIASDGRGGAICLSVNSGEVEYYEHELVIPKDGKLIPKFKRVSSTFEKWLERAIRQRDVGPW